MATRSNNKCEFCRGNVAQPSNMLCAECKARIASLNKMFNKSRRIRNER